MKINVVCSKCNNAFEWHWGKKRGTCTHCNSELEIGDVKMAPGEHIKLFQ